MVNQACCFSWSFQIFFDTFIGQDEELLVFFSTFLFLLAGGQVDEL